MTSIVFYAIIKFKSKKMTMLALQDNKIGIMVKKKKELSPVEEIKQLQLRIKELEKSEKSLKETERKFSDIIDNEVDWVWEVDARGKYTYSNPAVKDILGYRSEEIVGKYFYDLFDPEEREKDKKAVFTVFKQKEN